MQRNALVSALDVSLGRNVTDTVMQQLRTSIARARTAEIHPRGTRIGHHELETLMRQLTRPRRD